MGRKSSVITLTAKEHEYLETLTRARTIQAQTVNRARILLLKADGCSIDNIADKIGINRKSVMLCLNKYAQGGVENALSDAPGRGRNAEITDDEKAWIINIACQKPRDFGYSAETWTYARLTSHINRNAETAGFTRLSTIHKSTVHTILDEAEIKPFRIRYYCENRDPDFDGKMHNVLLVYKQLSMQFMRTDISFPGKQRKRPFTYFLMMKSRAFRQQQPLQKICCLMETIVQSTGIMNTGVLAHCPCLPALTCRPGKRSRWSARPITVKTILSFLRSSIINTQRETRSALYLIILRSMLPRKQGNTCPQFPGGLTLYLPPNMDHG